MFSTSSPGRQKSEKSDSAPVLTGFIAHVWRRPAFTGFLNPTPEHILAHKGTVIIDRKHRAKNTSPYYGVPGC
jgi:hypothetical protein